MQKLKTYAYYGSQQPFDYARSSEEGVIKAKNVEEAKKKLNKRYRYFLIANVSKNADDRENGISVGDHVYYIRGGKHLKGGD